jgi:hypothetical protein
LLVWLLVCRQGQTPQRGDRLLGLATADKEESAELHSGAILAPTRCDANTESSEREFLLPVAELPIQFCN